MGWIWLWINSWSKIRTRRILKSNFQNLLILIQRHAFIMVIHIKSQCGHDATGGGGGGIVKVLFTIFKQFKSNILPKWLAVFWVEYPGIEVKWRKIVFLLSYPNNPNKSLQNAEVQLLSKKNRNQNIYIQLFWCHKFLVNK